MAYSLQKGSDLGQLRLLPSVPKRMLQMHWSVDDAAGRSRKEQVSPQSSTFTWASRTVYTHQASRSRPSRDTSSIICIAHHPMSHQPTAPRFLNKICPCTHHSTTPKWPLQNTAPEKTASLINSTLNHTCSGDPLSTASRNGSFEDTR